MATEQSTLDPRLTDIISRNMWADHDAIESLRQEAEDDQQPYPELLYLRGAITPAMWCLAQAEYFQQPAIDLTHFNLDPSLLEQVPIDLLKQYHMLPISLTGSHMTVALSNPFDVVGLETLRGSVGFDIATVIAPEDQLSENLAKIDSAGGAALDDILREVEEADVELAGSGHQEISLDEMLESAEDAPVIRIVNSILVEALKRRASDIHIESMEKVMRLRYRIDGLLYESSRPPKHMQSALVSRIKIMSDLDIAERRIPQDGRFKIRAIGKECDVRVSILPTVHGEKIVMRILDKSALAPSLAKLGMDERAYKDFAFALAQPYGMLLVTGPTGSGKTTTLYSCLGELNQVDTNIVTAEDPVEYQLAGINQVQTRAEVGLTFAATLRSILRQDPDIVMVGEMRDAETAGIGVQAALTGHLVLSTLHTNDAAGAISRMVYMGIESFLLASSLRLTQAQRLYRKLCPACRVERKLPKDIIERHKLDLNLFKDAQLFQAKGCNKCSDTGYAGRGAVMEVLLVNDAIRDSILRGDNTSAIRDIAVANGMSSLRETGLRRVVEGHTTIEEILRITAND